MRAHIWEQKWLQHLAGGAGSCFRDWREFPAPPGNTAVTPELTTILKEDMGQRLGALKLSHGCSSGLSGVWLWFLVSLFTAGQRAAGRNQSPSCWLVFLNLKSGRKTYRLPPESARWVHHLTSRFARHLLINQTEEVKPWCLCLCLQELHSGDAAVCEAAGQK